MDSNWQQRLELITTLKSCEWSRSSGAPFLSTLHAFFR
jgi:hypothetical protein